MIAVEVKKEEGREKVLWVSKHDPLPAQIREIRRKIPDAEIIVEKGFFASAEEVAEIARQHNAKVIIAVVPLSFLARLVEFKEFTLLYADMELVRTEREYPEVDRDCETVVPAYQGRERVYKVYRFKQFKRIKGIKLELEDF